MNALLISLAVVSVGADSQIPPEMKVLEKMVGTWDDESLTKVAKWTPKETRHASTLKVEVVLGGRFLQGKGFDKQGKFEHLQMWTYDPQKKVYRWWIFHSNGFASEMTDV